ncbi:thioredoxin-like protein [Gracilibacillus halophilus YIM-C55.5]|uniref:Thioredoxin-like protein n=1 Tax=Gracilibacillus halophilus YIM-C55.5 TaxID=1308866 RepID=N4WKX0_9BACI|nr:thioredoxin family protein [Gracilibacillus halophilus]ENH96817.1 thioredoxin-like protein [Gracilibacillus halophilus YIM-C55.5]
MEKITTENWSTIQQLDEPYVIFVHTPFCATCQLAEKMLYVLEETDNQLSFYRMDASYFPSFMEDQAITSVPALLLVEKNQVQKRLYAFESVPKVYETLTNWKQIQSI